MTDASVSCPGAATFRQGPAGALMVAGGPSASMQFAGEEIPLLTLGPISSEFSGSQVFITGMVIYGATAENPTAAWAIRRQTISGDSLATGNIEADPAGEITTVCVPFCAVDVLGDQAGVQYVLVIGPLD